MKKILIIITLLIFNNCSGYKPILTSKDINFNIQKIEVNDNDRISYKITKKLKPYSNQKQKINNISLKIVSSKQINTIAKDSKGNDSVYEMKISTDVNIIKINSKDKIIKFEEKFSFNNQSNKFELEQYKKNIEADLIKKIIEKLILNLRAIK